LLNQAGLRIVKLWSFGVGTESVIEAELIWRNTYTLIERPWLELKQCGQNVTDHLSTFAFLDPEHVLSLVLWHVPQSPLSEEDCGVDGQGRPQASITKRKASSQNHRAKAPISSGYNRYKIRKLITAFMPCTVIIIGI
jgi:hypothetical protein